MLGGKALDGREQVGRKERKTRAETQPQVSTSTQQAAEKGKRHVIKQ